MLELIKQPNGKFCRVNYYGGMEFYNYTEEDIINMYIKMAKEDIENGKHYGEIIKRISRGNTRIIDDEILKEMGFEKSYNELVKYIPCKPINQSYSGCDFTTYGECPNCGGAVMDCMGRKNEKCPSCGQILEW